MSTFYDTPGNLKHTSFNENAARLHGHVPTDMHLVCWHACAVTCFHVLHSVYKGSEDVTSLVGWATTNLLHTTCIPPCTGIRKSAIWAGVHGTNADQLEADMLQ